MIPRSSYWLLLLLGGGAGLLLIMILELLRAPGNVRRLLLAGAGGVLAALVLGGVAGNVGLRLTEPSRPEAAYMAAGAVSLGGLAATVTAVAFMAYRQRRRPAADAPTAAAGDAHPAVMVRGTSPEAAARLEEELQAVAALVGASLVVQVIPRCPVRGYRLEKGVLLSVPRPRLELVFGALEIALRGAGPAPEASGEASSRPRRKEARKKLRPDDLAAAVGGREPTAE